MQTSGVQDGRVRTLALPMSTEPDCEASKAACSLTFSDWFACIDPNGFFSKTSPASYQRTAGVPLRRLPTRLKKSGIWGGGQRATLSTSVSPKTERGLSLSQVLEAVVPIKSLLTAANCAGIIRREERNGRTVPPRLKRALGRTIQLWCSVGEALGTPRAAVFAPRYVPKLESIKGVIRTGQYSVARHLTWRECERLMGFPDDWTVVGGD